MSVLADVESKRQIDIRNWEFGIMFCPRCGREMADDANFCQSCGYSFGRNGINRDSVGDYRANNYRKIKSKKEFMSE